MKRFSYQQQATLRLLGKTFGCLILGTVLLACTSTSTSDGSVLPQEQTSDSNISGSLSEPTGFTGEVPWHPLVAIALQDFAKLCVYHQEFGYRAPNQKQLEILQEARDSIYQSASFLSTEIYQEFLLELDFYLTTQLNFWEDVPDGNVSNSKPYTFDVVRNPCEIPEVKAKYLETGWDKDALIALTK
jgi:hypothetical protein